MQQQTALVNAVLDGCRKRVNSGTNEAKMGEERNKTHCLCPFDMSETFRETSQGNCSKTAFLAVPKVLARILQFVNSEYENVRNEPINATAEMLLNSLLNCGDGRSYADS